MMASLQHRPSKATSISLNSQLEASLLWQESNEEDLSFLYQNDFSFMSLKLNLADGLILFEGKDKLSKEEQDDLDAVYQAVISAFNEFKQESAEKGISIEADCKRQGNNLSIQIPTPKYYDAFVQKLVNMNLIPTREPAWNMVNSSSKNPNLAIKTPNETQDYKSPSPFDISKGPKPIE